MNIYEVEVPVPWGHVAGKAWGDKHNPIVLVFHGILDNAGSFDRLIPLLPKSFHYICFDLPGHGKSSHFPPFLPLHSTNNIIAYKLIVDYFKQPKYTIMGHSYGAQLAFLFAQLYPEHVESIIMLDTIHLFPVPAGQFVTRLRDVLEFAVETHEKIQQRKPPTYTYQEALQKLQDGRNNGHITAPAAEALLQRAIRPTDNDGKFIFTMDQRLKRFVNPMHDFPYIWESIKKNPVTCPVLMLLGRDSELQRMYMKDHLKFLRRNYKNIFIKQVDGHHDVHNNNPEIVAPYITKSLLSKKNKL